MNARTSTYITCSMEIKHGRKKVMSFIVSLSWASISQDTNPQLKPTTPRSREEHVVHMADKISQVVAFCIT